jgi:hypothetical protein
LEEEVKERSRAGAVEIERKRDNHGEILREAGVVDLERNGK